MPLSKTLGELSAIVISVALAIIFTGITVYVVSEVGTAGNISVLTTLATNLGNWATTWFPIILIIVAAVIIISLLIKGMAGGR